MNKSNFLLAVCKHKLSGTFGAKTPTNNGQDPCGSWGPRGGAWGTAGVAYLNRRPAMGIITQYSHCSQGLTTKSAVMTHKEMPDFRYSCTGPICPVLFMAQTGIFPAAHGRPKAGPADHCTGLQLHNSACELPLGPQKNNGVQYHLYGPLLMARRWARALPNSKDKKRKWVILLSLTSGAY